MFSRRFRLSNRGRRWVSRLLVALALGVAFLPALQPLLGRAITCGYDNAFHLYRGVQIDHLWDEGVLFSRWAPDMALGFGFPLFVFAGPLAHYLMALVHRLGVAWPVAMNAVFVIGIVGGGAGVYWLVQGLVGETDRAPDRAGVAGGLLAAVAYVYAPFLAYDVFNRGSLWESLAWAFPPLILLGVHRWSMRQERRYLALGVVALAAMVLCHYPFAALFAPIYGLWVLLHASLHRDWGIVWRGALLAVLGLGLTAFFWIPPLMERDYIQTGRLLGTWVFDYRHNFLPLRHLLALPRRADPRLVNDWPPKSLGLVPVLIALLPAGGLRRLGHVGRWRMYLLWGLAVGLAALTLPWSVWLWDHLPLLSYVQFPWRFLGPVALCLAMLIGHVPASFAGRKGAGSLVGPITALLIFVLVTANLGWFYPDSCGAPGTLTVPGILRWERLTDTLGTTAKGEYLPIWVERLPEVSLDEDYGDGFPVPRMRSEDLPDGAEILDAVWGPVSSRVTLSTPKAFRARYLAFYYPGWRVAIDGTRMSIAPEEDTGLITFDVPAGTHHIEVRFGETPLRLVGDAVSVLTLAGVFGVWIASSRGSFREAPSRSRQSRQSYRGVALWVLGAAVVIVVLKVALVDSRGVLWRSSRLDESGAVSGAALSTQVNFGNRALLLGTSAIPQDVSAADTPDLTLYWRALDPGPQDWHIGLTLVGRDGSRWPVGVRPARWGRTPPPLHAWERGKYARMDELLDLPVGLAPGDYELELALFDRATAEPASVLDPSGQPIAPAVVLGEMRVAASPEPPSLAALGVSSTEAATCGPLRLLQASRSHATAAPGDLVTLELIWELLASTTDAISVDITLTGGPGGAESAWTVPPVAPWWPTDRWRAGERWIGKAAVRLPGSLESGTYAFRLSVGSCVLTELPLELSAPTRIWVLPDSFTPAEVMYEGQIVLAGYELSTSTYQPGDDVPLGLAWMAVDVIDKAYRVFVHLVDSEGGLVSQNDGEPAGWTRPTPGWAPGEVILDPRPLQLPDTASPGRYQIRVGLYDQEDRRLLTAEGKDSATVAVLSVGQ